MAKKKTPESRQEELLKAIDEFCLDCAESDQVRAELAAEILGEVNPTGGNLAAFFARLPDTVHDELVMRAEDEEMR